MKKTILIGDGGHAQACIDVIEQYKKYSIAGFIVKKTGTQSIFGTRMFRRQRKCC